ncbi:hypothetical protein CDL12_26353 [Handroanthus impetiginosus]|uniref:Uncharacterized protein n=1 Tax=Handroanthus impetiginosus TaxID=429701 RepID=A0A2G9G758_9LAMI|nr:hypothetical protein CDL12_26353 [Handroanthus impetiginosus]
MANVPPGNLLDEALNGKGSAVSSTSYRGGRIILVEDSVETSGAFVVHHLVKRSLSPSSSDVVVFLSFAHPFSHYDRILRKMLYDILLPTLNVEQKDALATGLATDVHGQLTVINKGLQDGSSKSRHTVNNYHFRIKDSSVEYFYPGSKT